MPPEPIMPTTVLHARANQSVLLASAGHYSPSIIECGIDLGGDIEYVWADGVFLQARMEDHGECMLVLIGATPEGKKELIGFQVGVRESAQSWRELLVEVKSRGLTIAPEIAVGDGALGFWKALDEVFAGKRLQPSWVHKTTNVLNKVALSVQTNMKKD